MIPGGVSQLWRDERLRAVFAACVTLGFAVGVFAVSFGVSSMAVWALGPIVKASGFQWLMLLMAGIAAVTLAFAMLLPDASQTSPGQAKPEAA